MRRFVDKLKGSKKDGAKIQKRNVNFNHEPNNNTHDFGGDSYKHVVDPSDTFSPSRRKPVPDPISDASHRKETNTEEDVGTFSGFDGWLSSFTPDPLQMNIAEMPAPQAPSEVLIMEGFPREVYMNLVLNGIRKPSNVQRFTITVRGPWYMTLKQVLQLIKKHGYEEFVSAKHATLATQNWNPDEATPQDFQILVTDGPSCYDAEAESGLLVNRDDPLHHFAESLRQLKIRCKDDRVIATSFPGQLEITFNRTLRLPEDGELHNQPAGMGHIPVMNVACISKKLRNSGNDSLVDMARKGGVFFPLYQREAMFVSFRATNDSFAVRPFVGGVNAVSGLLWSTPPSQKSAKQDYVSVPPQRFLDGIAVGQDTVKQFIAMPLGSGYSVEKQITGTEDVGGMQLEIVPGNQWQIRPKGSGQITFEDSPRSLGIDMVVLDWADLKAVNDNSPDASQKVNDWIMENRPIYMRSLYSSQVDTHSPASYPYQQPNIPQPSPVWQPGSETYMTVVYRIKLLLCYQENGVSRTMLVEWAPWWKLEACFAERSNAGLKINGKSFSMENFGLQYGSRRLGPASLQEQGVEDDEIIYVTDLEDTAIVGQQAEQQHPQSYSSTNNYRPTGNTYYGQQMSSPSSVHTPGSHSVPSPFPDFIPSTTPASQGKSVYTARPGSQMATGPPTGFVQHPVPMVSSSAGYGSSSPSYAPASPAYSPSSPTSHQASSYSPSAAVYSPTYSPSSGPQAPTYSPSAASYEPMHSPSAASYAPTYSSPSAPQAPTYSPPTYSPAQSGTYSPPQNQGARPGYPPPGAYSSPQRQSSPPSRQSQSQSTDQTGWAMGIAAGSRIRQSILKDPFRSSVWSKGRAKILSVQILNSVAYEGLTGMLAPPTPVTAEAYTKQGLPFFAAYDEGTSTDGGKNLASVKSVGNLDAAGGNVQLAASFSSSTKVGCTSCGKMLCDSILRPCNHTFCSTCISNYMTFNDAVFCRICNTRVSKLIGFSAPMALPGEDRADLSEVKVITIDPYKGDLGFQSIYELDAQPQGGYGLGYDQGKSNSGFSSPVELSG
ncbi:hypothetical protein G7046_g4892 [Stylonectria norvegica]|nr:hypothetical protein G7046_g4892 [Stylonectria norvegica]